MAESLEIIIEVTDRASSALANIEGKFKSAGTGISSTMTKAGDSLDKFAASVNNGVRQLTGFDLKTFGVIGGVALLTKTVANAVNETMNYAEAVRDVARFTGASYEESSKLIQVADDLQIEISALKQGMRQAVREGISPTIEGLKAAAAEYKNLNTPLEKSQFALEKFGRAGLEMQKFLELAPEQLDEMAQSAEDLGLVLDEKAIAKTEEYRIAVDTLNDSWQGVKYTIGTAVIPVLADAANALNDYIIRTRELREAQELEILTAEEVYLAKRGAIDITNKLAVALMDEREESILANAAARGLAQATTDSGIAAEETANKYGILAGAAEQLASGMEKYTAQLLFKKAAENLDADAALALGEAMGLVDERTLALNASLPILKAFYDENYDGVIDNKEATAGYSDAVLLLNEKLMAIPDIQDTMDANHDGFVTAAEAAAAYDAVVLGVISDLGRIPREITTNWNFVIRSGKGLPKGWTGPPIVEEQFGGPVTAGKPYLVGEVGPELFVPNTSGRIVPNNQLGKSSGDQYHVQSINIYPAPGTNGQQLFDEFMAEMGRRARNARISGTRFVG